MELLLEVAIAGLRRHIKHVAVDAVFPAVVDAPQAAVFVAAIEKRGSAVRTTLAEQANASLAVAKSNQLFAQQPHANGRTIRLGTSSDKSAGTQ